MKNSEKNAKSGRKKNKPDKKTVAIAKLIENVADAGGPMEAVKVVDDRAYRKGVRDGKRMQRSADVPVILAASGTAALLSQVPHLLLHLSRKKDEKTAREQAEAEKLEAIRRELEEKINFRGEM